MHAARRDVLGVEPMRNPCVFVEKGACFFMNAEFGDTVLAGQPNCLARVAIARTEDLDDRAASRLEGRPARGGCAPVSLDRDR